VIWTREDDIQHDYYRPANSHQLRAVLGSQGLPLVWEHAIAAPSILRRRSPAYLENNFDASITEGAHGLAYEIPNVSVNYREADLGIPVGYWRSVGHSYNCFVVESFIDEVARAAGADPYQYRRRLLSGAPRLQRVLDVVAQAAQWGQPSGEIAGSGIAVVECYGSYVAQVVEVVNVRERFQIRRVVCAVDCGQVVNPGIVAQQMEGGIIYALTAALQGRISIANGAIEQSNFHDYPMLRLQDTPAIEVHIVPSTEPPGGAGEPGVPALAAALANALAAAGGRRQRRLPLGLDA